MVLIIGGRYQGKLDFARAHCGLEEKDICYCIEDGAFPDFHRRCLAYVDRFALGCVRRGEEPADAFRERIDLLRNSIILSTDISCGVVPMDAEMRAWREACGRMNSFLASRADEVWRLFCGLPQRIK